MNSTTLLLQVFVAAILGGLIGVERGGESHSPAGLRTNMIIAMSSCLFTILSVQLIANGDPEGATLLAHIISGVGFLGAGAIFRQQSGTVSKTSGMTTAATIWLVAGIGMTVGMGQYFLAIFLEPLSEWLQQADMQHHKDSAIARKARKTARA